MKWNKMGHVFSQNGNEGWKNNSALTPTPFLLDNSTIRVYAGFRDKSGTSRIGYVDVDSRNPLIVKKVSKFPVLDVGRSGCFDDNGVILGDIVRYNDKIRMYYVGFQLVNKVKFLAFTGLAESYDNGESFHRVSESPIIDRHENANMIGAIHTVIHEENIWRSWYAAGDGWQDINGVMFPKYNIWHAESLDGVDFSLKRSLCIDVHGDEYRIGRPSVYKHDNKYFMFYTKGGVSGKDYFPGVAYSDDGISWERKDQDFGLALSKFGFDSLHLCYPRLIIINEKVFCFYNGNNMGQEGFGVAELVEW